MAKITLLGTGLLGTGIAENLLNKGHTVTVWNRSPQKLAPLVAKGAIAAETLATAVAQAERVHLVLSEDTAVESVLAAALPALPAGVFVLDHSTNLPEKVAARSAHLRASGIRYLHAPVFMSPQNGREGSGLILLAAPQDEATLLLPALSEMTGKVWHVGERADLAAVYKLMGNAVLVSLTGMMGDLLSIGAAQGLQTEDVLQLFEHFKPAGALPMIAARVARGGQGPASFELKMARKDVRLMIETAGGPNNLVVLPGVADAMDRALAQGHAERDYAIYANTRKA